MSIPPSSDAELHAAQAFASECRNLADDLDREVDGLGTTLAPVISLHTPATWDSTAAAVSRNRVVAADAGIAAVCATLRAVADALDAAAARAQADVAAWASPETR